MVETVDMKITITALEWKALAYVAVSPDEWVTNAAKARAAAAMQEIYEEELRRMQADPSITMIPKDRDEIIKNADIETAAEKQARFLANPPIPPEPKEPA